MKNIWRPDGPKKGITWLPLNEALFLPPVIIPSLLHNHLSTPLMCYSPDQAAHYHIPSSYVCDFISSPAHIKLFIDADSSLRSSHYSYANNFADVSGIKGLLTW